MRYPPESHVKKPRQSEGVNNFRNKHNAIIKTIGTMQSMDAFRLNGRRQHLITQEYKNLYYCGALLGAFEERAFLCFCVI